MRQSVKRRRRGLIVLTILGSLLVAGIGGAAPASAHPLGNFTVNQSTDIVAHPDTLSVSLVVDMAEIPAYQTRKTIDRNRDGTLSPAEQSEYQTAECAFLGSHLSLTINGSRATLTPGSHALSFPQGAAGLSTLRLECEFTTRLVNKESALNISYENANFANRIGWREITSNGDGMHIIGSNVPSSSISDRLTKYPNNLLLSPLDQRSAQFTVERGGPRLRTTSFSRSGGLLPRGIDRATRAFTSLIAHKHFTVPFALLALLLAVVLGAIHALAPGHGKTIVAAYLVGQRGSLRHSMMIGGAMTLTHTVGVLALGIALTVSQAIAPERLYPILGLASGALLASIGLGLLRRAIKARRFVGERAANHGHPTHDHGAGAHSHDLPPDTPLRWKSLLAMGFAGGLVPSPSALVVLLGAIALGRAWFGVVLVVAYGAGMAGVLISAALLFSRARGMMDRRASRSLDRNRAIGVFTRLIPAATASVIVVVGSLLAIRGAMAIR